MPTTRCLPTSAALRMPSRPGPRDHPRPRGAGGHPRRTAARPEPGHLAPRPAVPSRRRRPHPAHPHPKGFAAAPELDPSPVSLGVGGRRRDYRGSPVPVTGTDGALQLVGLTASALSPGSANLGNVTGATLRACGSGTRRGADPASGGRVCLPPQGSSWVFLAAVSHDTTVWCPWDCSSWSWSSLCSGDVVQLVGSEQGKVSC